MRFWHCFATPQVKVNCSGRSVSSGDSAQTHGSTISSRPSEPAVSNDLPSTSLLTQMSTLGLPKH